MFYVQLHILDFTLEYINKIIEKLEGKHALDSIYTFYLP